VHVEIQKGDIPSSKIQLSHFTHISALNLTFKYKLINFRVNSFFQNISECRHGNAKTSVKSQIF